MSDFKLIEAANGSKPKIVGMAYGGGKLNLGWMHPVVVDLEGVDIPETVPLLTDHDNKTESRVGLVSASIKDNTLEISGEIIAETEEAKNIIAQLKAGAEWQLSIGADVKESVLVKSGTKTVNGQAFEAPFYHVISSTLREVSVVAVGADASTSMKIAAKFNLQGEQKMSSENKIDAAVQAVAGEQVVNAAQVVSHEDIASAAQNAIKAERKRVSEIKDICGGEFADIENEAIEAGWDANQTRTKVLEAFRAKKPASSVNVIVKEDKTSAKTLEAALALRSGISAEILAKSYGEETVDAAMKDSDISLKEMMQECMRLEGRYTGRSFDNATIQAALSSVNLPGILSNVANKKLLQAFEAQPVIATQVCSVGDLTDFKEAERYRLTDVGDLKVVTDGEITGDGNLAEERATNKLETYGKKFCLTRQMIINDDLGAFLKVPTAMGNRAARLIDQLFFSRLLANPAQASGNKLFSAANKNILSGADTALGIESLQKAMGLFMDQTDADGQPIGIEPRFLVVPTDLRFKAMELAMGDTIIIAGSDAQTRTSLNAIANQRLQVVSSPYLGNSTYDGASKTGWYLFGDPNQVETFEIGYLRGKRTPTVERGETDFNTLGMWFRVYFDLGVREQGHRGMVFADGK